MSPPSQLSGPIGGASGDAGAEYRRGVAAYIVSRALAGKSLRLPCVAGAGHVRSVALETDDPVDDIRVDLESGVTLYLQAKLSLGRGRSLEKAVAQWRTAALEGLDPSIHRLVIVSNKLSGSMGLLSLVLDREREGDFGGRTDAEADAVAKVDELLGDLSDDMKATVRKCAAVWELEVVERESRDTDRGHDALESILVDDSTTNVAAAWTNLMTQAGRAARLRSGSDLTTWMRRLVEAGFPLTAVGSSPAARSARRTDAIDRYAARLQLDGHHIDLQPVGAEFPPLPFETLDGSVRVHAPSSGVNGTQELLWTFLHRHRVVLTGLPGGGKSTAAKRLAADLISDDNLPFPVLASLRDLNPNDATAGIREQIIARALRDATDADRGELRDEINRRVDGTEPVAFILDGLDEAYDTRVALTAAIGTFAQTTNDNTFFLLTTRSAAFAHAENLEWAVLELGAPEHSQSTAWAILEATAAHRKMSADSRERWVTVRAEWVRTHLEQDKVLAETPLMVALLTVLASHRNDDRLPTTRGAVLKAIVEDFVGRKEVAGRISSRLTRLGKSEHELAGMAGFVQEADYLMEHPAGAPVDAVVTAVTDALHPEWIDRRGPAQAAAAILVHAFDEAGVFVIDDDQEIAPRLQLLAEIGSAMRATEQAAGLKEWVVDRIGAGQHESVNLACLLSPDAVNACVSLLDSDAAGRAAAHILAAAEREGAALNAIQSLATAHSLMNVVARSTYEGWRAARLLMNLRRFPEGAVDAFEKATSGFDPGRGLVVRAYLSLRFPERWTSATRLEILKETFALPKLPPIRREKPRPEESAILDLLDDGGLRATQLEAAHALLAEWPETADLIAGRIGHSTPRGLINDLLHALRTHGFAELASRLANRHDGWEDFDGPEEPDVVDICPHTLHTLSALPTMELSAHQRISMVELGIVLNAVGSLPWGDSLLYRWDEQLATSYIQVALTLLGLDPRVVAGQATEALRRTERYDPVEPIFAMHSETRGRRIRWDAVPDATATARILTGALRLPLNYVGFAADALARGPRDIVEPLLIAAVSTMEDSPQHQKNAAIALVKVTNGEAARPWLTETNPFLRNVAACACSHEERLGLLSDPDRGVRFGALKLIVEQRPTDLADVLTRFLAEPECGWTCDACRKVNETWDIRDACSECLESAPDPRTLAKTTLRAIDAMNLR